jgi:hypothetical protein
LDRAEETRLNARRVDRRSLLWSEDEKGSADDNRQFDDDGERDLAGKGMLKHCGSITDPPAERLDLDQFTEGRRELSVAPGSSGRDAWLGPYVTGVDASRLNFDQDQIEIRGLMPRLVFISFLIRGTEQHASAHHAASGPEWEF